MRMQALETRRCKCAPQGMRRSKKGREKLKQKVDKLRLRLGEVKAGNRKLKHEINERRLARLNHLEAVKLGGVAVESAHEEVDDLIVAAQRAYAEKEVLERKLTQRREKAEEEIAMIDAEMDDCDVSARPEPPPRPGYAAHDDGEPDPEPCPPSPPRRGTNRPRARVRRSHHPLILRSRWLPRWSRSVTREW